MIKIVIITGTPFPADSSATGNRCLSLAKGLMSLGDKVEILTSHLSVPDATECIVEGIKCYSMKGHPTASGRTTIRQRFRFLKLLNSYLKKHPEVQFIWSLGWHGLNLIPLRFLTKKHHVRLVREINEFPGALLFKTGKSVLRRRVEIYFEQRMSVFLVDGLTIMTRRLLSYYTQFAPSSCRIIHLPMTVDVSRFNICCNQPAPCGIEGGIRKIIYCGSMNGEKDGVSDLIKAFSIVAEKHRKIDLWLYGDGDAASIQRLKRCAAELMIADRIHLPGRVPSLVMPGILCDAHILALIRPNNLQAQGGFPTKLGEYLCTGRPVVVTKVGEIPEYLVDRENAYLCEPSDPAGAAACFEEILSDYERALQVGRRGRQVAETDFNGNIQAQKLHDLVKELIGSE